MPCTIWPPPEPLSSFPCLLSFPYNIPGRFLPPGTCPCSSLCWEHSSSNRSTAHSLTSFWPLLESHLREAPWWLYFKWRCSSLAPLHCLLSACIYNYPPLYYIPIANFSTSRISVPWEKGFGLFCTAVLQAPRKVSGSVYWLTLNKNMLKESVQWNVSSL